MKPPDHPLRFESLDRWRAWLEGHHASEESAWLVILKSRAAGPGIYYEDAVEEALCFGWIDGVMKSVDAEAYYLRFSPRKQRSNWSVPNQKRVEKLIAQGRMTDAGMAKVREAKENREWEAAIRREDTSRLPDDLLEALAANPEAQANFDRLSPSQKKQFLYWIASARTEGTRCSRIQLTVEMAADNRRLGAE